MKLHPLNKLLLFLFLSLNELVIGQELLQFNWMRSEPEVTSDAIAEGWGLDIDDQEHILALER